MENNQNKTDCSRSHIHKHSMKVSRNLVNKPRDGAPMTRLLIADLETSSAIAFATLSDSKTTTSTSTYIQKKDRLRSCSLDFNIKLQQPRKSYLLKSTHLLVWKKQLTCLPLHVLSICSYYIFSYF